jgi:DNA repair/transcription protein MET18/MMS19
MVLAALRRLSTPPALFETLVIRLLTKIDLVMHTASTEDEPSAAYIHALLHTISSVLAKKVAASDTDVPKYIEKLVPKLYEIFILSHSAGFALANVPRLVDVTSDIIALVIETISQRY